MNSVLHISDSNVCHCGRVLNLISQLSWFYIFTAHDTSKAAGELVFLKGFTAYSGSFHLTLVLFTSLGSAEVKCVDSHWSVWMETATLCDPDTPRLASWRRQPSFVISLDTSQQVNKCSFRVVRPVTLTEGNDATGLLLLET